MSRGKKHTAEQIISKLREAEAAKSIGVTSQTYFRWRKAYVSRKGRWSAYRSGEASERVGEAKLPLETPACRCGAGQGDLERSRLGKLLSPAKRRAAVAHVRDALGRDRVSERRACQVLDQPRSTQRRSKQIPSYEPRLVRQMVQLASDYGRYGYRRVTALLRAEGWQVKITNVLSAFGVRKD